MRVVFTVWPNPAHLYPLVPLAWAMQSAGHEVRIASHHAIADSVCKVGLAPQPIGDPAVTPMGPGRPYPAERERLTAITEALALPPSERDSWDIFNHFMLPAMWDFTPYAADPAQPMAAVDDLVRFTRGWQPDLVLWDPCMPLAAVAARACGAAHARLLWGQDYFGWTADRFAERAGQGIEHPMAETVRGAAERYGLRVDDELLVGQWTVDPTPEGIRLPTSTRVVPLRWVPFAQQTPVPDWLVEPPSRPRVAMSLGLSQRMYLVGGWGHVPNLLEMVSELDIEVVATLNERQLAGVGTLPDNVRAVDYIPLTQLLPTCSAMIHHGGMGTFAAAAALNVPQLITDWDAENQTVAVDEGMQASKHVESTVTARYVTERGAGLALDINVPVDVMRKQLVRVLEEPSFAEGAASVYADVLATPSPNDLTPILERLAARYRGNG